VLGLFAGDRVYLHTFEYIKRNKLITRNLWSKNTEVKVRLDGSQLEELFKPFSIKTVQARNISGTLIKLSDGTRIPHEYVSVRLTYG